MPIRFRCEHCQQLLGIARRKSGCEVDCPKCKKLTRVPDEPVPMTARAGGGNAASEPPLLERPDFDQLLEDQHGAASILGARSASPPPAPSSSVSNSRDSADVAPLAPAPLAPGGIPSIVLTSRQATWLTVAAIGCMAVSFGAGLLVGRYLL